MTRRGQNTHPLSVSPQTKPARPCNSLIIRLLKLGLKLQATLLMQRGFDVRDFVEKLNAGAFDDRLNEELGKLSYEELEQVALLLAQNQKVHAA